MPAAYTYNDAINDAQREVMKAWEETKNLEPHMAMALDIVGRLERLKRRNRRKRHQNNLEQEVGK